MLLGFLLVMFTHDGRAMEEKKKGTIARLLNFAGDRAGLTYVGCVLSAAAMVSESMLNITFTSGTRSE